MTKIKHFKEPEKVPLPMQKTFDDIVSCTDEFCKKHLSGEYAELLRKMTAVLCRKRPSPLLYGSLQTWTAGMVHAIGTMNFLFDPSQKPYLSSSALCNCFGLAQSTVSNKSKQIRDMLKMSYRDANWLLPSKIENRSSVWTVTVNGFLVDARSLPIHLQEIAFRKGLIPYIPAIKEGKEEA